MDDSTHGNAQSRWIHRHRLAVARGWGQRVAVLPRVHGCSGGGDTNVLKSAVTVVQLGEYTEGHTGLYTLKSEFYDNEHDMMNLM